MIKSRSEMISDFGYRIITDNVERKRYQKIQKGKKIDVTIDVRTGNVTVFEHRNSELHHVELPNNEMRLFKMEAEDLLQRYNDIKDGVGK